MFLVGDLNKDNNKKTKKEACLWFILTHSVENKGLLCWLERLLFNEVTQF